MTLLNTFRKTPSLVTNVNSLFLLDAKFCSKFPTVISDGIWRCYTQIVADFFFNDRYTFETTIEELPIETD